MGGGNNAGGVNPNLSLSNMPGMQVQPKFIHPPSAAPQAVNPFQQSVSSQGPVSVNPAASNAGGGQPSTQQLRMLVHQIQMAVQAGYLNHQILNQPLAPQTLVLLNQLLNNIKVPYTYIVQGHFVSY
jgi:trinucleotide repeat-containing gene 6 protein